MINTPIKHVRLNSMEELLKFSYETGTISSNKREMTYNNGQIAFADERGHVYVTPYRPEIFEILLENGFQESKTLFVPFSNGEECPDQYKWLRKIAKEEAWAYTNEKAAEKSASKGIKAVKIQKNLQIKEISPYNGYNDTHTWYYSLVKPYLQNSSEDNIGTYIVVDEKTLVACDEYGRTFLIKAKTVINDIVNALIAAGYTRTPNPEKYICTIAEPTE